MGRKKDIVKRLRAREYWLTKHHAVLPGDPNEPFEDNAPFEAADEIERLRGQRDRLLYELSGGHAGRR